MKSILWLGTVMRADEEQRAARRPLGRDPRAFAEMLQEYTRVAGYADDLGFWAIGTTEHHLQTEGGETVGNTLMLYGKVAMQTRDLKFIPLSIVLPIRDPIRVAEDLALFDHLYPGRLAGVSLARGYQTRWMNTLGQAERNASSGGDREADQANREKFDEYLEVVQKAWDEDSWDYDGEHYKAPFPHSGIKNWPLKDWTTRFGAPGDIDDDGTIHKIGVVPKPLERPRIFHPYTMSKQTLVDAAQRGNSVLVHLGPKEEFRSVCELYKEEAKKAGKDVELGQNIVAIRKIFIGDTFDEAFDLAVETAGYWHHNFFGKFGFNEAFRTDEDQGKPFPLQFDDQRALIKRNYELNQLICGTPEQVTEQIQELKGINGAAGHLEFLCWEYWGQGHPDDSQSEIPRRQLELYANKVVPNLT